MIVFVLGCLLQVLAAALAWRITRGSWRGVDAGARRPAHRHVARYLALVAATDPLRAVIAALVLRPAREALGAGVPYQGLARWVFHVDQALFLIGPIGLAVIALLAFLEARAPSIGHILGASALLWVALAVSYPGAPGPAYEAWRGLWWPWAIAGVHALAQLTAWGSAVWWSWRKPGEWPHSTLKVVMALAAADIALWLAGVLPGRIFTDWHLGDAARAAILAWICWEQVAWIRSTRPTA